MTKTAKRERFPLHGWLNLHKPAGIGSTPALGAVKRAWHPEKAGHGGTLDPLASGVLPIALGEATKTVAYAMDADKEYDFTITWGESRDTQDAEGQVIATSDARPTPEAIKAALPRFIGHVLQVPPQYSAIKIDGQRAYDLARAGEAVEIAPRPVEIFDLKLLEATQDTARLHMVCGKGTYVRALARDLAHALGVCGYITTLIRTRVGPFAIEDAISLDLFRDEGVKPDPKAVLQPVQTVLDDIPALAVDEAEAARLRRGMGLNFLSRMNADRLPDGADLGPFLAVSSNGVAVAMVRLEGGEVKPERVFNLF
ncbi:MAG: tRNA pseudouridine(55) synthase TruB [Alphaproteobacteria bacterium]|nr:tRNA pseudouridine(55) synthase TruB [Alphaproteobacteria bacterium]